MPADVWLSIATQIPVVLLFCAFMGYVVKLFLTHINAVEARSQAFIQAQREANNEATKELATEHRAAIVRLTDSLCKEMDGISSTLAHMNAANIGHDTYVRTAFKERFGLGVMSNAESAASVAEAQAKRE